MKTVTEHIRQHALECKGIYTEEPKNKCSYESLKLSEWDEEFERLMRNRLIMGALRYGKIRSAKKKHYDRTDSIKQRLELFISDGNGEHLVDIANICLLIFAARDHQNYHFSAQDDVNHIQENIV